MSTTRISNGVKKIVCIIQARMGSTRLPGKILLNLEGKSVLLQVIDRVLKSKKIYQIVVATTTNPNDRKIVDSVKNYHLKVSVFRGSEEDVLDRYYQAAKKFKANVIVRVTADCPLIDWKVLDKAINVFLKDKDLDYASNVLGKRTYPRGLDVEVLSFQTLERIWQEVYVKKDREHVTLFIKKNPNLFKCKRITNYSDYSCHRWTLDEKDDYKLIKLIYQKLYPKNPDFGMREIIKVLNENPELAKINKLIEQKNPQF